MKKKAWFALLQTEIPCNDLIEEVGPHIAALKTHVDLVDDWTPESWIKFCKKANDADLLILKIGNLLTLVKLLGTKCLEFTILTVE